MDNQSAQAPFSTPSINSKSAMVTQAVRLIFSGYRRDDFADPEMFAIQLGTILERYSDQVIRFVSHPLSGIQRRCKFPPSISEVVTACDEEAAAIARRAEWSKLPKYQPAHDPIDKPHRGNVLVHKGAPQYEAMVARSKDRADPKDWRWDDFGTGIWVPFPWLDEENERKGAKRLGVVARKVARA